MLTKMSHRAKQVAALLLVATTGIVFIKPVSAIWWAPAPRTCHTDAKWIWTGNYYYYAYAYQYRGRYLYTRWGINYYERKYVYDVQNFFYGYGMLTVGRAEDSCGVYTSRAWGWA